MKPLHTCCTSDVSVGVGHNLVPKPPLCAPACAHRICIQFIDSGIWWDIMDSWNKLLSGHTYVVPLNDDACTLSFLSPLSSSGGILLVFLWTHAIRIRQRLLRSFPSIFPFAAPAHCTFRMLWYTHYCLPVLNRHTVWKKRKGRGMQLIYFNTVF
jgi:hypothetical protein